MLPYYNANCESIDMTKRKKKHFEKYFVKISQELEKVTELSMYLVYSCLTSINK